MSSLSSSGKKTNKHKQLLGTVLGTGGGQICLCVAFFLGTKRKQINKIPRKSQENAGTIPGQSRDNPGQSCENVVYVFCCLLVSQTQCLQNGVSMRL